MSHSVLEEDLIIEGNVTAEGGVVNVKGRVTGDIAAKSVDVHGTGQVQGAVTAETLTVQGKLSGRIDCTELTLSKTSEVRADITAQTLTSEKGARLVGKVEVVTAGTPAPKAAPAPGASVNATSGGIAAGTPRG